MQLLQYIVVLIQCYSLVGEDISNSGAEYLHSAISDLKNMNKNTQETIVATSYKKTPNRRPVKRDKIQNTRILSVTATDGVDRSDENNYYNSLTQQDSVPQLSLTKGELLSMYEAAIKGGNVLNTEQNNQQLYFAEDHRNSAAHGTQFDDDSNLGYYYYYYPLKNIVDGISTNNSEELKHSPTTTHPEQQQNIHTHLHNVKIEPTYGLIGSGLRYKALEPLFMAISSFVGMAMMFLFSMVFLPKFKNHKSRTAENLKPQIISLSEVIFEVIDGHDCRERLVCEAGHVIKALQISDNRFVKLIKRMVPKYISKKIEHIQTQALRNKKCVAIRCKNGNKKNVKISLAKNGHHTLGKNGQDKLKQNKKLPKH